MGYDRSTITVNGNLTSDDHGHTLVYDAWGRLVAVENGDGSIIEGYQYDGLGRRTLVTNGTSSTDLYYSGMQVIEQRTGVSTVTGASAGSNGTVYEEFAYSPIYTNAPILRDKDTNGDGTLDQRVYYTQDANFNVTAIVNATSSSVLQRMVYDPYGSVSFKSSSWGSTSDAYGTEMLFQGMWNESAAGLYLTPTRAYSPTLDRFIGMDWSGWPDGPNNYWSFAANPINGTDPSGLVYLHGSYGKSSQARNYQSYDMPIADPGNYRFIPVLGSLWQGMYDFDQGEHSNTIGGKVMGFGGYAASPIFAALDVTLVGDSVKLLRAGTFAPSLFKAMVGEGSLKFPANFHVAWEVAGEFVQSNGRLLRQLLERDAADIKDWYKASGWFRVILPVVDGKLSLYEGLIGYTDSCISAAATAFDRGNFGIPKFAAWTAFKYLANLITPTPSPTPTPPTKPTPPTPHIHLFGK
jgi:RHS repeat-associated protein